MTALAFRKCGVSNETVVVRNGAAAPDYLFATGKHSGRDAGELPTVVLLDLQPPKINGLEVLRRIREDERTRHFPVVVLTRAAP
jgi:CheY-like chemotaxis protein